MVGFDLRPVAVAGWRWCREIGVRLAGRRDRSPIDSVDALAGFVATRAAFIAQKTLYGYLRTRIGTRYPEVFAQEAFARSVDVAKMQVFGGCLSDLAVYAARRALAEGNAGEEAHRALARRCMHEGLERNLEQAPAGFDPGEIRGDFETRLAMLDWQAAGQPRTAFVQSPRALLRWAPIAQELKDFDAEIVENSVRFAWLEVVDDLGRRLRAPPIRDAWCPPVGHAADFGRFGDGGRP